MVRPPERKLEEFVMSVSGMLMMGDSRSASCSSMSDMFKKFFGKRTQMGPGPVGIVGCVK